MARSYDEIKQSLAANWMQNPEVINIYNLSGEETFENRFSPASIENILLSSFAFGISVFERILDVFKSDITTIVSNMKPHTIAWYINKIKSFQDDQDGEGLLPDSDQYEIIDENKQIVKYVSLVERQGYLYIKVAAQANNQPVEIGTAQLSRLEAYLNRVKDAGVHYELVSRPADDFKVNVLLYYDPLYPSPTENDIKTTINEYLASMPFDGVYSNMGLTDKLQTLPQIKVVQIRSAAGKYGANDWQVIESIYTPDAGYMKLSEEPTDTIIDLIPYNYAN